MEKVESKGKIYVLFGFDGEKFITQVEHIFTKLGYEVVIARKYSKESIRAFLQKNPEYNCAVLKESMGRSKYSAEELAELCDIRDMNIIAVLGEAHKGTAYMQTLYNAGITSALFASAGSSDATPEYIVRLILEKRPRNKARQIYGLVDSKLGFDVLTPEHREDCIAAIQDGSYGESLGQRFLMVMSTLKTKQAFQLIKSLPPTLLHQLEKTDEFYQALLKLKERGVTIKKKMYVEGMETVLKKKTLEGKKKSVLEIKEDASYKIKQEIDAVKQAEVKEEYASTGSVQGKVSDFIEKGDEYESVDNLNMAGSYYADGSNDTRGNEGIQGMQSKEAVGKVAPSAGGENAFSMEGQQSDFTNVQTQQAYTGMQMQGQAMMGMQQQTIQTPPPTDWRELRKWQKNQAKMQKLKSREMLRNQRINNGNNKAAEKKQQKARKRAERDERSALKSISEDKPDMKPFIKTIIITIAVLAFVAIIGVVIMASFSLNQQTLGEQARQEQLLTEQMNDLSEIRGDTDIDLSKTTPLITSVTNGDVIMGIDVMNTINTSDIMLYVITLDGQLFTYEHGGATSEQVDVNSMYRCQLLSSGRFIFIQQ